MVQDNGFEVLSLELKIRGKLRDISKGGMSYQYTPPDGAGSTSEVIDILGKKPDRFLLAGMNCDRIYDIAELAADRTFTGAEIRLRGLEYLGLTEEQTQKLDVLMKSALSA
jgi:hypothetical protein